jgi:CRP/FNR family nitrogen fixation transcriptional regulator
VTGAPAASGAGAAVRTIGGVRLFAPQKTIFAEGDPATHFMLVIHGLVRSCSVFADGRRFIGAFHAAGDVIGLELDAKYLVSAEAVCETAAVFYPTPDWFGEPNARSALPYPMLGALLRGASQARGHARLLGRSCAIEKISVFLLECLQRSKQGTLVELEMNRQDIGDYLGMTVETVSRGLARLRQDGLIGFRSSRQLVILDAAKLRSIVG